MSSASDPSQEPSPRKRHLPLKDPPAQGSSSKAEAKETGHTAAEQRSQEGHKRVKTSAQNPSSVAASSSSLPPYSSSLAAVKSTPAAAALPSISSAPSSNASLPAHQAPASSKPPVSVPAAASSAASSSSAARSAPSAPPSTTRASASSSQQSAAAPILRASGAKQPANSSSAQPPLPSSKPPAPAPAASSSSSFPPTASSSVARTSLPSQPSTSRASTAKPAVSSSKQTPFPNPPVPTSAASSSRALPSSSSSASPPAATPSTSRMSIPKPASSTQVPPSSKPLVHTSVASSSSGATHRSSSSSLSAPAIPPSSSLTAGSRTASASSESKVPSSQPPVPASGSAAPASSSSSSLPPSAAEIKEVIVPTIPAHLLLNPDGHYTFIKLIARLHALDDLIDDNEIRLTALDQGRTPEVGPTMFARKQETTQRIELALQLGALLKAIRLRIHDMVVERADFWASVKLKFPNPVTGAFTHSLSGLSNYFNLPFNFCMLTGKIPIGSTDNLVPCCLVENIPGAEALPDLIDQPSIQYHHPCFGIVCLESVKDAYHRKDLAFRAQRTEDRKSVEVVAVMANPDAAELELGGYPLKELDGCLLYHISTAHAPHGVLLNWHLANALKFEVVSEQTMSALSDGTAFESLIEPAARPV